MHQPGGGKGGRCHRKERKNRHWDHLHSLTVVKVTFKIYKYPNCESTEHEIPIMSVFCAAWHLLGVKGCFCGGVVFTGMFVFLCGRMFTALYIIFEAS